MLINLSLKEFLKELQSDSPAPGGGSVAALAGALGGSLVSMVGSLSKKQKETTPEIFAMEQEAQGIANRLAELIQEDTDAFNQVMKAFKLPKETEQDKDARKLAIQIAYKEAADTPLQVMEQSYRALELAEKIAAQGNPNALSDAGVAGLMSLCALKGAALNVLINLSAIKDAAYVKEKNARVLELKEKAETRAQALESFVYEKLTS